MLKVNDDDYTIETKFDKKNNITIINRTPKLSEEEFARRKRKIQQELYDILSKYNFD